MLRWLSLAMLAAGAWWIGAGRALAAPAMDFSAVTREDIVALARRLAASQGEDASLVLALIEIESAFDPRALRPEPRINDASRGLMQLLLSTARDRGFDGPAESLFDPETNISLGIAQVQWIRVYLTQRRGRAPTIHELIGAYNAGVGNVMKGFVPLGYVQRFLAARAGWRKRGIA